MEHVQSVVDEVSAPSQSSNSQNLAGHADEETRMVSFFIVVFGKLIWY